MFKCEECNKDFKSINWLNNHKRKKGACKRQKCKKCSIYLSGPRKEHKCIKKVVKKMPKLSIGQVPYKTMRKIISKLNSPLDFNSLAINLGYTTAEIIMFHIQQEEVTPPERMIKDLLWERSSYQMSDFIEVLEKMKRCDIIKGTKL